jgi:hypothetical protein
MCCGKGRQQFRAQTFSRPAIAAPPGRGPAQVVQPPLVGSAPSAPRVPNAAGFASARPQHAPGPAISAPSRFRLWAAPVPKGPARGA